MDAGIIGRKVIKITNNLVNYVVLTIILLLIFLACYALWDSNYIHQAADKANYAVYKPTVLNQGRSFMELQALNAEVIAWLCVYGTNIDYPVTQGLTNMKYVNTNAEGQYSLAGSIFLDCRNNSDFSDFNSILYGHHMAKKVMFGEIDSFSEKAVFDSHRYGNLYFNEKDHGIEFFAFVQTDAYDSTVFMPNIQEDQCYDYLESLFAKALHIRDIAITAEDHIVLLSTCSSRSTNGRDILVGKITNEVYENSIIDLSINGGIEQPDLGKQNCFVKEIPIVILLLALLLAIRLIIHIYDICHRHRYN